MYDYVISAVWDILSYPDSEYRVVYYRVGWKDSLADPKFTVGSIVENRDTDRVYVWDTEDRLRISLPLGAVAIEYRV